MWTKHWSRSKQAPYWCHSITRETSWTPPSSSSSSSSSAAPSSSSSSEEWVEKFSKSKQAPYWVNIVTNESTWKKPSSEGSKKRKREGEVNELPSAEEMAALEAQLEEERQHNALPDSELPRELDSTDIQGLVQKLHKEEAKREDIPPVKSDEITFRVVFTLADEDTSHITRAIQEDEILKTRLKLKKREGVIDLPSFWDQWKNSDSNDLKKTILASSDPHEAKWSCARQYGYKMATTFMPGYAKGWGDRLLGASAANCVRSYVGFDPNKCLRPGYAQILRHSVGAKLIALSPTSLSFSNGFQVHSLPFEEGAPKLLKDNSFDLVFTSPPFFDYEMYNPDNPQYRNWLTEFYEPLFKQADRCVKPQGFVCIHIGDTSAGEIVPFLKNRVNKICHLKLMYTVGLTGVMSRKIREVWVFQNTEVALAPSLSLKTTGSGSAANERRRLIYKWTNPPVQPKEIYSPELQKSFVLLDDGACCVGGTKQRLLGRLLEQIPQQEIVYAGPGGGMAQVALSYTARMWNKKAVIFLNGASDDAMEQPLVRMAKGLGGDIRLGAPGEHVGLRQAESRAEAYVAADPSSRFLSPFGLRKGRDDPVFQMFRDALVEALCFIPSPPKRLWLVSGSGFILDVLHSIWPKTKFMIVQVGKKIWREVLEGKQYELFVAVQDFSESVDESLSPPYRYTPVLSAACVVFKAFHVMSASSVPWYDAKLWQFVKKHGESGDFIWNVAAVPDDIDEAVKNALDAIKS